MYNARNEVAMIKAMRNVIANFGDGEFTAKQYKAIHKAGEATVNTLHMNHMIKIVRKEFFTVKLPEHKCGTCYALVDDNGVIHTDITEHQYRFDTTIHRMANMLYNNGNEMQFKRVEKTEIQGVRYYYQVDFDRYEREVKSITRSIDYRKTMAADMMKRIKRRVKNLDKLAELIKEG